MCQRAQISTSCHGCGTDTYRLVASYGANVDFAGSASSKGTFTVAKATSKTALKLSATKLTYGDEQVEHLSATVSPEYPGTRA